MDCCECKLECVVGASDDRVRCGSSFGTGGLAELGLRVCVL